MGFKFWNEYVGKKFGLLKVLEIIEPKQAKNLLGLEVGRTYFACKCKCGEVKFLPAGNVKSGAIASCGSKACKAELLKLKRKKAVGNTSAKTCQKLPLLSACSLNGIANVR